MTSPTRSVPFADPTTAEAHFARLLELETDCWDVHASMTNGDPGFVLLQTNGTPESFAESHVPGAIHLPHADITEERMAEWPSDTHFVVYCSGPHCNGADRGALALARLGRPVKKMIGGKVGWLDEGFELVSS